MNRCSPRPQPVPWAGCPHEHPQDRPPSPRAALPFVLNKCTLEALPSPRPTRHAPRHLPTLPAASCASHISRYAACRFPVHSGSSDKLPRSLRRRAPRARQRLAARAAGGRPEPESPARPKIRSKLSLASPIPYGDRAGERQFPPSPPPIRRPRPGSSGDRPAGSNRQGRPPKRRGV